MTIHMNDSHLVSIAQIQEFLKVAHALDFHAASRKEKYAWLTEALNKFNYFRLKRKDKSIVKAYLMQNDRLLWSADQTADSQKAQ